MPTSLDDVTRFIARQKALLTNEREEEVKRTSLLLSKCSQKTLEQNGLALGGLGVVSMNVGLGGKTLVELERPSAYHSTPTFPPHTFRPGDLARLEENQSSTNTAKKASKGKTTDAAAVSSTSVEGVVFKVSDTRIIVAVDPSRPGAEEINLPERIRILKLANSVTYDRMDDAVDRLERVVLRPQAKNEEDKPKWTPERTKLIEVLLGLSPLSPPTTIEELTFLDPSLNPSQKSAVKFAIAAPELACIHGPPGTGKTHTLIELIRQLCALKPPQRILVCGASNLAVDNILERLLAIGATIGSKSDSSVPKATRIGHPARVLANSAVLDATLEARVERSDQAALAKDVRDELEVALATLSGKGKGAKGKAPRGAERRKMWDEVKALRKEYRQREGGSVKAVLQDSQIVVCTCHSSGGRQLFGQSFDVVIIDEATQALEAVCYVPIFKAKKLVLAGDPKQLPPTVMSVQKREKADDKAKPLKPKDDVKKVPPTGEEIEGLDGSSSSSGSEADQPVEEPQAAPPSTKKDRKANRRKRDLGVLRPPHTLETTLFERLERMHGPQIKRMLDVQYRMHKKIAEFPNKAMYGGRLKSHESVASRLLRDLPNAATDEGDDGDHDLLDTPVVFFDTAGCEFFERTDGSGGDDGSKCNENEAEVVRKWVVELIEAGVLASQIAVITPYQAQVALISALLRPNYPEIEIGSVDGMQGREKDAVVISLVRSNDKREVGFLKEKRRLNVAMTRARRSLCIVGDSETVQHGSSFLKRWMAWLESNADVRFAGEG